MKSSIFYLAAKVEGRNISSFRVQRSVLRDEIYYGTAQPLWLGAEAIVSVLS